MNSSFIVSFNPPSNASIDEISRAVAPFIRPPISPNTSDFRDIDDIEVRLDPRVLKEEINCQLNEELAIAEKESNEERQLHREIAIFEEFIARGYFETLEGYSNITVALIRREIRQALADFLDLTAPSENDIPVSSLPSSPLTNPLTSVYGSSPPKKVYAPPKRLKLLPRAERTSLAVAAVQENKMSARAAATMYGANRKTIKNRLDGKRTMTEYSEDRQLLTADEETAILRFIDNFAALGFPLRLHMLEEKALLLLRIRCKNPPESLGHN